MTRACEDCGQRGVRLERHHLRYEVWDHHGPESIVGRETPDDLALLCRECHRQRHVDLNGSWWNDPEEKYWYWESFFDELHKAT
jgi:HNH endonuclease